MTIEEFINKLSKYPRDTHITLNSNWEKDINIIYYPKINSVNIVYD